MGCASGAPLREDSGQAPSSGRKAKTQCDPSFYSKYSLDARIGKGSYALVHAVSEKTQADELGVGAKVKVQIVGSKIGKNVFYNGCRGQIVEQKHQHDVWHVKLNVAGKAEWLWMKGENLILEQGSKSRATRAVKILDLRDVSNGSDVELCDKRLQSCKNEVSLWKKIMYHPNMVRLHEVFSDKYLCYFVMERCKSSLFKYMEDLPVINERSTGKLLVQMILAINHMHSHRVVHRDVKPDNFLMGGNEGSTLKLCDYGLSAMLPEEGQLPGVHGTAPYMCPEMLRLRLSDEKADVWSVGVVAYLLLCGKFPYQPSAREWNGKKMQELIRDGARPTCERSWLSDSASFMLKKMLTRKSVPRPSAQEALHLPFIVDNTLDSKESEENLPCLRSVLEAAVSLGSSHRNLDEESSLDLYLNFKQDFVGGVKKEHVDTSAPNDEGDGLGPELDDAAVFEKGDHINVSKQTFTWKASRDDVDGRGRDQITES